MLFEDSYLSLPLLYCMKLLRFFNTLNIDTALGAASFVYMVSYIRNEQVDLFVYLALIMGVLSIYNLDHLVDAFRLNASAKSYRHSFYQQYFKSLLLWQAFLLSAGLWVLFQLSPLIVFWGGFMSIAIGAYFLIIFNARFHNYMLREIVVALGYTISVAVIPFAGFLISSTINFYFLFLIIFLVALTNLWVFALFDVENDEKQNHHSIARGVEVKRLIKMTRTLILLALIIIIAYTIHQQYWLLGAVFIGVEISYLAILHFKYYLKKNEYYRLFGELVLVLPGLILWLSNAI